MTAIETHESIRVKSRRQAGLRAELRQLAPLTGLWTMHVWIYWFNLTPLRDDMQHVGWLNIYAVMTAVLLAVAARLTARPLAARMGRRDVLATAAMCACTVSVAVAAIARTVNLIGPTTGLIWSCANVLGAGACMSWGYLRWFALYADLGIRDAVACLFLSYLVGSTLKIAFDVAPAALGAVLALALPAISLACLRGSEAALTAMDAGRTGVSGRAASGVPRRGEIIYTRESVSCLARIGVCVFVFCLLRYVVPTSGGLGGMLVGHAVEVVFSLAVLTWVLRLNRSLDFPQLWRFVFLFLSAGIALGCLGVLQTVVDLCMHVVASLVVMLLWLLLADVAHHSDIHPGAIFGVGWSLYVGANYLGNLALTQVRGLAGVALPGGASATVGVALGVAALWALGVTMAFCLETRDPDVQRVFADLRGHVTPEEYATLDERCAALARACGMTERELDVFRLLARGRSKNFIAEELCVSENTVRGHARHIYSKLGVHTRDELQNKLEM